jgi:hypothetical protein
MLKYLLLCEPEEESGDALYRCLDSACGGIAVLFPDLPEHAAKEHQEAEFSISDIEIGFDLSKDDPDPKRQRIRCRPCGNEIFRTEAAGHAKNKHTSAYVYVNLLV